MLEVANLWVQIVWSLGCALFYICGLELWKTEPRLFVINLSSNNLVYFAGSNVEESVTLELLKPKKLKVLQSCSLHGLAYVLWTEEHDTDELGSRAEIVHYSDTQILLENLYLQLWEMVKTHQHKK